MAQSARKSLDALIRWIAVNRARAPKEPLRVNLAHCTCERFCTQVGGKLFYKGHRIIPLNQTEHCGAKLEKL